MRTSPSDGLLLVIAAASGTGKSTLCDALLQRWTTAALSISYTTRPPRSGEKDGTHYHFISKERFQTMIDEGQLLEWASVHDNFYGTGRHATETFLRQGRDVLLDIDIQGARSIRRHFGHKAILIFLLPPSWQTMVQRLKGRGTETDETIRRRLQTARQEIPSAGEFDYIVVNDDLERALTTLLAIREAEMHRAAHARLLLDTFLAQIPPTDD